MKQIHSVGSTRLSILQWAPMLLATVVVAQLSGASQGRAQAFDPCESDGLDGEELEECRTFLRIADEITTRVQMSQMVHLTLEQIYCIHQTGDWQLCWEIHVHPDVPIADQPDLPLRDQLSTLDANAHMSLHENLCRRVDADYKRRVDYLDELLLDQ